MLLFRVANIVLIAPHSNAGIERVFSLVNKNKPVGTERNRIDIDGSLASILAVKFDRPESKTHRYDYVPDAEMLEQARVRLLTIIALTQKNSNLNNRKYNTCSVCTWIY